MITCDQCHEAMEPRAHGRPKRFCSRKCSHRYHDERKPKAPKVEKSCPVCTKTFITNIKAHVYCSSDCRYLAVTGNPYKPEVYVTDCDRCGETMERTVKRGRVTYCDSCRLISQRERYRMKTVRRQGALASPRISCDEIAVRDNFICHICSELVDMTIPRTSRMGATMDHVVPLSKGGLDTLENLKLAHWICNILKSNKMIGGVDA